MKMQINPESWTDSELNITVNESRNTMKMYDDTFTFKKDKETGDVTVFGDDWDDDYVLCSGCEIDGIWYFDAMGLTRGDKNMYCAAAKVLANII